MARLPRPVEVRSHHTRPWGLGVMSAAILTAAILGAVPGCRLADGGAARPGAAPTSLDGRAAGGPADRRRQVQPFHAAAISGDRLLAAHRPLQARARRLVMPADPVAVDLYTLDATCGAYQVEPIWVPRPQSMETTVAWILAEQTIPGLALSGYRTRFDPATKTVTIDLRVARTSRRLLQSLSICEQRALLGSLRETLIHQPDWQIAAVIVTNRGNPLEL